METLRGAKKEKVQVRGHNLAIMMSQIARVKKEKDGLEDVFVIRLRAEGTG